MKGTTMNILVVDDNSKNIQLLISLLQNEGYAIGFAMDGIQALEVLKNNSFDLILLDVIMPNMDGYETLRHIKQLPAYSTVPVMFITAMNSPEEITKGFEVGAVDYVNKPFNKLELLARVKTHLKLKDYENQLLAIKNSRDHETKDK